MKWSDHTHTGTVFMAAAVMILAGSLSLLISAEALTFRGNQNVMVGDLREQERNDMAVWGSGETAEVYAVFEDYSSGPNNPHIYFKRSTNGGRTFQSPTDFLQDGASNDKQFYPSIDVYDTGSGREIAVGYIDNTDGATYLEYNVLVQTSSDGGQTWSTQHVVTDGANYPTSGLKSVDLAYGPDGNLFVTWGQPPGDRIWMAYSTDNGLTWSTPQKVKEHVNPEQESYTQTDPTIASDGDYVGISWQANPDYKTKVYVSTASISSLSGHPQLTFSTPTMIAKPIVYPMYQTYSPRMVGEDGKLHLVWWDFSTDANGNNNEKLSDRPCIKYTSSDNGGSSWAVGTDDNVIINTSTPDGWHSPPDIEVGPSGLLAVSWIDTTNNNKDVFVSTSTNGGSTWSSQDRCNNYAPSAQKFRTRVGVDNSGNIHVTWLQRKDASSDKDLFHSRSIVNQAPEAVENLMVVFTEERDASVSWSINVEPDFAEYRIHKNKSEGFTPSPDTLVETSTDQSLNIYDFSGLTPDTTYHVKIVVADKLDLTTESESVNFTTIPINQPPQFEKQVPTLYMIEDTEKLAAINMSRWVEQGWITDDNYGGQTEIRFDVESKKAEPEVTARFRTRGLENPYWLLDLRPAEQNWDGSVEYRIEAIDAGKDGGFGSPDDKSSFSNWFDIQVNSTNDVPTWLSFMDMNTGWQTPLDPYATNISLPKKDTGCIERQEYEFAVIGDDTDGEGGDFLTFTVDDPRLNANRTLDPILSDKKSLFSFVPTNDDVPELNFTITMDDGFGGVRNLTVYLPVANVNNAPYFLTVEGNDVDDNGDTVEFSVMEMGKIKFNVTAGDIDPNDSLTLKSQRDSVSVKENSEGNWTVTFTALEDDTIEGNVHFELQLLDLERTDLVTLKVNVDILNRQDRPQWISGREKVTVSFTYDEDDQNEWGNKAGGEKIQAEWGEPVTFEAFATDKDQDPLEYTWRITSMDNTLNETLEGKEIEYAFSPTKRNLSDPGREKFGINVMVSDGHTEPIEYYRELWVEPDDDNDNDGMPDRREIFFWGDLSHDPDDDEDSDDYTNVEEIGFQVPRYESEMKPGPYSLNSNEVNPTDPEVYPGHVKPIREEDPNEEEEDPLGLPTWLLAVIIVIIVILILVAAGIFFIISMSKRKERKEEEDIEKRVQEMEKKAEEKSGLYGKDSDVDKEEFGPDQSTLDDLELDVGGGTYHEDGARLIGDQVKKGDLESAESEDKQASSGPNWESGSGPLFDYSVQGLEFGQSLEVDNDVDMDNLDNVDDDALNNSMDALIDAAEEYNEDEVKDAGGKVLPGAVPMKDQVEQSPGGPRNPPPGMEETPEHGQQPPKMDHNPVPKPKVGKDE